MLFTSISFHHSFSSCQPVRLSALLGHHHQASHGLSKNSISTSLKCLRRPSISQCPQLDYWKSSRRSSVAESGNTAQETKSSSRADTPFEGCGCKDLTSQPDIGAFVSLSSALHSSRFLNKQPTLIEKNIAKSCRELKTLQYYYRYGDYMSAICKGFRIRAGEMQCHGRKTFVGG